jgi:hypothetical protein
MYYLRETIIFYFYFYLFFIYLLRQISVRKVEYTKRVIRSRKSKNRQHNGQTDKQ